ncbi:hypothetical protein DFH07DRAFT_262084 [Mycena maculata]|uniref:Uncharacterized protein n=1 Tax=Mycena maculata TaxID=230809 RepID=A0AAD7HQ69_9AGAR|nr:hypothetical protein DFH07DRAFT_262084 [Mycena maculata]
MGLLKRFSSCRLALQLLYGAQRRTFMDHPSDFTYKSPVLFGKIRNEGWSKSLPPAVTTLDPTRINHSNYFEISNSTLRAFYRRIETAQIADPHGRQFGDQLSTSNTNFPEGTRGFLYLYSPPNQSPLGGAVRFRLAENSDARSFVQGRDLLMAHDLPWQIPIWEILTRRLYQSLAAVLEADGFAPREMKLASKSIHVIRDSVFVTALGQPWAVDWGWEFIRIYVVPRARHPMAVLVKAPWHDRPGQFPNPYRGRGLVSIIRQPDGEFGLRVDKVLRIQQQFANHKTIAPSEGLVTPLRTRPILKSTKTSEKDMNALDHYVTGYLARIPWLSRNPNILDVYRHLPLSKSALDNLGWHASPSSQYDTTPKNRAAHAYLH